MLKNLSMSIILLTMIFGCFYEDRENAISMAKCQRTPCNKGACFFWDEKEKRCATQEGLDEIYSHKYKKDSVKITSSIYALMDEYEKSVQSTYRDQQQQHITAFLAYLDSLHINNVQKSRIISFWTKTEDDPTFAHHIKQRKHALQNEFVRKISTYTLVKDLEKSR